MRRTIQSNISKGLYDLLVNEKKMLNLKEKKKRKSIRRRITFYDASQSIVRKAIR